MAEDNQSILVTVHHDKGTDQKRMNAVEIQLLTHSTEMHIGGEYRRIRNFYYDWDNASFHVNLVD